MDDNAGASHLYRKLTAAATAIFQGECDSRGLYVQMFTYVDHFMMLGVTHKDVKGAFAVLHELGAQLYLVWKLNKDEGREQPHQQV